MKRPPTDLKILEEIYRRYYSTFVSFSPDNKERVTKNYVPIDIVRIADHFAIDKDIVFGRLYYHLERKYGYTQPDGSKVHLFSRQIGDDRHCVQFPLLASAIASLREERNKYLWAIWISIISLVVSLAALAITVAKALGK